MSEIFVKGVNVALKTFWFPIVPSQKPQVLIRRMMVCVFVVLMVLCLNCPAPVFSLEGEGTVRATNDEKVFQGKINQALRNATTTVTIDIMSHMAIVSCFHFHNKSALLFVESGQASSVTSQVLIAEGRHSLFIPHTVIYKYMPVLDCDESKYITDGDFLEYGLNRRIGDHAVWFIDQDLARTKKGFFLRKVDATSQLQARGTHLNVRQAIAILALNGLVLPDFKEFNFKFSEMPIVAVPHSGEIEVGALLEKLVYYYNQNQIAERKPPHLVWGVNHESSTHVAPTFRRFYLQPASTY